MGEVVVEGLTKRFRELRGYRDLLAYPLRRPTKTAVDGITLDVGRGEVFGLLGENGAGKTTLIRILATTLIPTSGTATVAGMDVVHDARRVRAVVGVVSGDERSFYWRLTGRENLDFFAALHRIPRQDARRRIDELVDVLGLGSFLDRPFQVYSSGIKQRFAIARGLLANPTLLFLDEPTRALDPIAADEVRRYVADQVRGEGTRTILLATHALDEAERLCDRVAIMRRGRVYAMGTVRELQAQSGLSHVLEAQLAGDATAIARAVARWSSIAEDGMTSSDGRVALRAALRSPADLNDVVGAILSTGARLESVTTRAPTLDDVYRAVHAHD